MALRRGFAEVKKAKERSDQNRAAAQTSRQRELFLKNDGQEVEIWFLGTEDTEPVQMSVHVIRLTNPKTGKPMIRTEFCAKEHGGPDHDGCVFCWAVGNGDARVSTAKENSGFSVANGAFVHKQKDEEATKAAGGRFERFKWQDCTSEDDEPNPSECKWCKRAWSRERRGLQRLRLSTQAAASCDGANTSLHKKCMNCTGKIRVTGYKSAKGKIIPPDELDSVADPAKWAPIYKCRGCDDPKPANLFACPITFRRNGSGMTTTYSFIPGEIGMPPDWVLELEPIDWEKSLIARNAAGQAKILGINNPFEPFTKKSGQARGYEEEPDDEPDPFAGDEEEAAE